MGCFKKKVLGLNAACLLLAVTFTMGGCGTVRDRMRGETVSPTPGSAQTPAAGQLTFGNPSNASSDDPDNYLIVHTGHVLSYNNSRGTLNWAAWRTSRSDLGDPIDRPLFEPDPLLPLGMRQVGYYDYSGSGYDRGHIVPSADRFGDRERNRDTFRMTNIVPQTGALNQFPWEKLESYARLLAYRGHEIYTIAGVYGDKGRLRGKVTVPSNCWKIVVVFGRGQKFESIDTRTRIIAVDMPNVRGIENVRWETFRTSVRDLEGRTGYNFFSDLRPEIQEKLETRIDNR